MHRNVFKAIIMVALFSHALADGEGGSLGAKLQRSESTASTAGSKGGSVSINSGSSAGRWSVSSIDTELAELYGTLRRPGIPFRETLKKLEENLQPDSDYRAQIKGLLSALAVGLATYARYGPVYGGAVGYMFLISTDPARVTAATIALIAAAIHASRINRYAGYVSGLLAIASYLQWL